MQLRLQLSNQEEIRRTWAFARPGYDGGYRSKDSESYVISACSKQAKSLGVRPGMYYTEAKQLIPGMKILLI